MILKWTLTLRTYFSRKFLWAKPLDPIRRGASYEATIFCFVTRSHNSTSGNRLQSNSGANRKPTDGGQDGGTGVMSSGEKAAPLPERDY